MKVIIALLAVIAVVAAQKYTTKYDGVDLNDILKNTRLFNGYYKCLMDDGPCTPDGSELKRVLPDALKSDCAKCSDRQRDGTETVIKHLSKHKATEWKALQAKYDPEGIYVSKYSEEAKKRGIAV